MNLMRNLSRLPLISNGNCCLLTRACSRQTSNASSKLIIEPLTEREIIRVKGDEVVPFLQGLITNDIKHLHPTSHKAIYAMFLNKAGRVLYDTILYSTSEPNTFLIECDKNVANELQRHLKLYRVRRNIDIDSVQQEVKVWQAFNEHKQGDTILKYIQNTTVKDIAYTVDPRLKHLGVRLLANSDRSFSELTKLFEVPAEAASDNTNFRLLRYNLGVAEGVIDLPPGKCFPLEANCDLLNGVSFHKGCYIGQELTARVHHTGVIRKRHMPVKLAQSLNSFNNTATVQNEAGANCGTIFGVVADKALGLLRVDNVLKSKVLLVNGIKCCTEKPKWWPQELQSTGVSIRRDI